MENVKAIVDNIYKAFEADKEYGSNGKMVVNSVLDLGSYYVANMVPKNMPKDEFFIDGLFKFDKKTGKVSPFCIEMDREKYLKALKNPFYLGHQNGSDD